MAAKREDQAVADEQAPETKPARGEAKAESKAQSDVLVYIDREGAITCQWYDKPKGEADRRAQIPQAIRVRLEPGMSFCPGQHWAQVSSSPSYRQGLEAGRIIPMAGHRGTLADEWGRCKAPAIAERIRKTFGVEVLLRLQDLEREGQGRDAVMDAIAGRLDDLKVRVAQHDQKRRAARRGHRRPRPRA